MGGRYRLRRNWEQDLQGYLRLVIEKVDVEDLQRGSDEIFPRSRMPIVRLDEGGQLVPELRTVQDRAPMVLLPSQYSAWLAGGIEALQLVGTHPDAGAFEVATA